MKKKDNFNYILEKLFKNPYLLRHESDELKDNYDVVIEVVKKYGRTLEYASNRLKNNFNIVMKVHVFLLLSLLYQNHFLVHLR